MKKEIPNVIISNAEGGNCTINLYQPFGLKMQLSSNRPEFNQENFLCVPGAYTTTQNQIDGLCVVDGIKKNNLINPKLNGVAIISDKTIRIVRLQDFNDNLLNQVVSGKKSIFQQTLLIKDNQIVPCNLFGIKENRRRALIQFEDFYCIGESSRPLTISEFQESLVNIGAVNAVNLDMGTWSEGWYKNNCKEKIIIGEYMYNTNRQTNWLLFTK
ncbi:phosphodiester glycosidase family protein [Flavobacterium sp. RSSA_27]|uniref:phosphodiester glycosidase family protein n=1 Tax=Flavobacterium sp. RSSA_27 TaxID=3447667 RepID=UPI003F30A51E